MFYLCIWGMYWNTQFVFTCRASPLQVVNLVWTPPMDRCLLPIAVLAHACGLAVSSLTLFLKALLNPVSKPRILLSDLQKQVTLYPMLQGQYKPFNNPERVSFSPRSTFSHYPRDIKRERGCFSHWFSLLRAEFSLWSYFRDKSWSPHTQQSSWKPKSSQFTFWAASGKCAPQRLMLIC